MTLSKLCQLQRLAGMGLLTTVYNKRVRSCSLIGVAYWGVKRKTCGRRAMKRFARSVCFTFGYHKSLPQLKEHPRVHVKTIRMLCLQNASLICWRICSLVDRLWCGKGGVASRVSPPSWYRAEQSLIDALETLRISRADPVASTLVCRIALTVIFTDSAHSTDIEHSIIKLS